MEYKKKRGEITIKKKTFNIFLQMFLDINLQLKFLASRLLYDQTEIIIVDNLEAETNRCL